MIPLFSPYIGKSEESILLKILRSKFWASGAGEGYVKKFEDKFKEYTKSKFSVAVNSGTAALNLCLSLIDLKNKEVILPSLTFVATANAIRLNGGKPVFVDVDPISLCLDPDQIKKSITSKTKVILPVHFGGMSANLKKIQDLCLENDLDLVEDAAHAAGSSFKGKKIGSHGKFVCFSFHPVKNLAMPTGGLISINNSNQNFVDLLHAKRWCGITQRNGVNYDVKELGWNYYMDEFSAGIGLQQLKKLDKMNSIRKKIAKSYSKKINLEHKMPFNTECSYHLYWIRVKNRKKFMSNMRKMGIETGIHYNPIHKMSLYSQKIKLDVTDNVSNELVSIPMHPNLKSEEVEFIIKNINNFSNY
jgi:perosamine synthetase